MSSSLTILHHLGLDPLGSATACSVSSGVGLGGDLHNALLLCILFSACFLLEAVTEKYP